MWHWWNNINHSSTLLLLASAERIFLRACETFKSVFGDFFSFKWRRFSIISCHILQNLTAKTLSRFKNLMLEAMYHKTFTVKWQLSIVIRNTYVICSKQRKFRLKNFFISDTDYSKTSAGVFSEFLSLSDFY